ncbi:MAG: FkbM family methyltransferase [Deltaproteobacteria bacterium]|nr:MAG: FkbM family methyltransferase [Deltaproteobacteria bacterium]
MVLGTGHGPLHQAGPERGARAPAGIPGGAARPHTSPHVPLVRSPTSLPSGLVVRVRSLGEWWLLNEIFVNGEYEAALAHLLHDRPSGPGPVVIVDLLRRAGIRDVRVLAVEVDEECCRELERRMRENALTTCVELVRGAIGSRDGIGCFEDGDERYARRVVESGHAASGPSVPYVDLMSYVGDVQAVDLIKCDVEGAELLFLRSYPELLRSVRTVVMELHPELCDADECLRLLGEYGLARQTVLRAGDFGSTVLAHR